MTVKKYLINTSVALAFSAMAGQAAAMCATDTLPASLDGPDGFPERALTMIVPYGPAGGSGQVAQAMAEAVTGLTKVSINRDHKPGGSGTVGMTSYMAAPADGYTVLEHIDDAASAHALDSSKPNPAEDLIPLVTSQITFSLRSISAPTKTATPTGHHSLSGLKRRTAKRQLPTSLKKGPWNVSR